MVLTLLKDANLGLAFFLELGVLATLCYFGFVIGKNWLAKGSLSLGLLVLAVLIWGMFGAPQAAWRLSGIPFVLLQILFFGSAALALVIAHKRRLGLAFGLAFVINIALAFVWGQQ